MNNIIVTLVKNSPANVIKVSAATLNLSFSLFDRCDSDKPEKINYIASFWRLPLNILQFTGKILTEPSPVTGYLVS